MVVFEDFLVVYKADGYLIFKMKAKVEMKSTH